MLNTFRVASYGPSGQGEAGYEAAKGDIIALIVICIAAIMAVLVTRKDLCEVRIRTSQAEVAVFTAYEPE